MDLQGILFPCQSWGPLRYPGTGTRPSHSDLIRSQHAREQPWASPSLALATVTSWRCKVPGANSKLNPETGDGDKPHLEMERGTTTSQDKAGASRAGAHVSPAAWGCRDPLGSQLPVTVAGAAARDSDTACHRTSRHPSLTSWWQCGPRYRSMCQGPGLAQLDGGAQLGGGHSWMRCTAGWGAAHSCPGPALHLAGMAVPT